MSKLEFVDEPLISPRFVDRIEVAALKVLDERHDQAGAVVQILDERRNLSPPQVGCGPQPPFAGDELVSVAGPANRDGLQEPAHRQGRLKLSELIGVEGLSW